MWLPTSVVVSGCLSAAVANAAQLLHDTTAPMTTKRIKSITGDVCKGMAYLHGFEPPILHRDLKPANLLITAKLTVNLSQPTALIVIMRNHEFRPRKTQVKICDFGLSVQQPPNEEGAGEGVGAVDQELGGTAPYSAPEVLLGKELQEGADVFAFGVILWEIITRRRPWAMVHPARISALVGLEDRRLEISAELRAVPDVEHIVEMCFRLKPSERPSFTSLIKILDEALV
eukprot:COSAG01_NODE_885_length_12924_cov_63.044990_4_plen_230_part_00